jgi:hypothetical protein
VEGVGLFGGWGGVPVVLLGEGGAPMGMIWSDALVKVEQSRPAVETAAACMSWLV